MQSLWLSRFRTLGIALIASAAAGCGGGGDGQSALQADGSSSGGNAPPTIQGSPGRSILVGRAYSFQPVASDADGDALTFSVANLPAWASFNATTGRISGTPTAADVGSYANITLTASDGHTTASLAPFAINVTASGMGVATLSWTPPTQNTDGSTLSNLAGYQVLFGQSATDLDQTIELNNPSLSTYVVDNLTSGTWYFAVIAVNVQGVASTPSSVTSKTIS
jgi:hypothetical protein